MARKIKSEKGKRRRLKRGVSWHKARTCRSPAIQAEAGATFRERIRLLKCASGCRFAAADAAASALRALRLNGGTPAQKLPDRLKTAPIHLPATAGCLTIASPRQRGGCYHAQCATGEPAGGSVAGVGPWNR